MGCGLWLAEFHHHLPRWGLGRLWFLRKWTVASSRTPGRAPSEDSACGTRPASGLPVVEHSGDLLCLPSRAGPGSPAHVNMLFPVLPHQHSASVARQPPAALGSGASKVFSCQCSDSSDSWASLKGAAGRGGVCQFFPETWPCLPMLCSFFCCVVFMAPWELCVCTRVYAHMCAQVLSS